MVLIALGAGCAWISEDPNTPIGQGDDSATTIPEEECPAGSLVVPERYTTIQEAIDASKPDDTVCVLPGDWVIGQLTVSYTSLRLLGVAGADRTVLTAAAPSAVIAATSGGRVEVEGFTLRGGITSNGGCLYLSDLTEFVGRDLVIEDCSASSAGAGIYAFVDSVHLERVSIRSSTAGRGAGLLVEGGSVELVDVVIEQNESTGLGGGGVELNNADAILTRVEFLGNRTEGDPKSRKGGGGALMASGSTITASAVRFVGNVSAGRGGALFLVDSEVRFANTDIVGNQGASGGGVYATPGSVVAFHSSVFASNLSTTLPGDALSFDDAKGDFSYSDFFDHGNAFQGYNPSVDPSNLFVDPVFTDATSVDPLEWDTRPRPGSPLIDAGSPTVTDIDGGPSDIGAYGGPDASW